MQKRKITTKQHGWTIEKDYTAEIGKSEVEFVSCQYLQLIQSLDHLLNDIHLFSIKVKYLDRSRNMEKRLTAGMST